MSTWEWLGVAVLGAVGALGRFAVSALVTRWRHTPFPVGTLAVNLIGGFALGIFIGAGVSGTGLTLAGAGLLGAFTTFSTWMVETEQLARDGRWGLAGLNLAVPMFMGVALTGLGWALGSVLT